MPLRIWTFKGGKDDPGKAVKLAEKNLWGLPTEMRVRDDPYYGGMEGCLTVAESGEYFFHYAADDRGMLYLSSDENPKNKKMIAWNQTGPILGQSFGIYKSQYSMGISLEKGKKYYLEATCENTVNRGLMKIQIKGPGFETFTRLPDGFVQQLDGTVGALTPKDFNPLPLTKIESDTTRKGTLKAHLMGFRGVGTEKSSLYHVDDGTALEPRVVLRLANGTKRMFERDAFSQADKEYITGIFHKEMARIRKNQLQVEYRKPLLKDAEWPDNAKPGEPGTMQVTTKHMIWLSGSQSPGRKEEGTEPWVHEYDLAKGEIYRDFVTEWSENMWSLYEYGNVLMPSWENAVYNDEGKLEYIPNKYWIDIPGTRRDGHKNIPGFAGGGGGGCGIKGANIYLLAHEWGHGMPVNGQRVGGGEAGADTCATFSNPEGRGNVHPRMHLARNLWGGVGGYCYVTFYSMMSDNPNWGHAWFIAMPIGHQEHNAILTISRVLEQRKMAKPGDGIRSFGDMMGEYAARLATFDCEMEMNLQHYLYSPNRTYLEPVNLKERVYQIPSVDAPEPFGANVIKLHADEGAKEITVDFEGMYDPDTYSDWRACMVAVDKDGQRRYSKLWNKGKMSLSIQPGDASHLLTVAATPTAVHHNPQRDQLISVGMPFSGQFAPRFPWKVQFTGAIPGNPQRMVSDYGEIITPYERPLLPNLAKKAELKKEFTALLDESKTEFAKEPTTRIGRAKKFRAFFLEKRMEELLAEMEGSFHKNGGGFVQSTAKVADTAYVGDNAMVLGNARVQDNAIVEEYAVVKGDAVVKDHARVSGISVIDKKKIMDGFARSWLMRISADQKENVSPLPIRQEQTALHKEQLWANFAMDCSGGILLENYYRHPTPGTVMNLDEELSMDGYVYGRPAYVKDGERNVLKFNGKDQYAEFDWHVFDLAETTIAVTLKRETAQAGTLLDLGSDVNNAMVLAFDPAGIATFTATVSGKKVIGLKSKAAVPAGKYAQVRIEMDGQAASLWVDNQLQQKTNTSFRPCDVFLPDAARMSTLATDRGKSQPFAGTIDSVVVYHTVHEEFAVLAPPTLDSPRRPTVEFAEKMKALYAARYGNVDKVEREIQTTVREEFKAYQALQKECEARINELLMQDAGYRKALKARDDAKADLAEKQKNVVQYITKDPKMKALHEKATAAAKKLKPLGDANSRKHNELRKHDDLMKNIREEVEGYQQQERDQISKRKEALLAKMPKIEEQQAQQKAQQTASREARRQFRDTEEYHALRAKIDAAQKRIHKREIYLRNQLLPTTEEGKAYQEENQRTHRVRRDWQMISRNRNLPFGKEIRELNALEAALAEAEAEAWKEHEFEKNWVNAFPFAGFVNYYNRGWDMFMTEMLQRNQGGKDVETPRENIPRLMAVANEYAQPKLWTPVVNWDWRVRDEIDGSIKYKPLVRDWLMKVRGPYLTKPPVDANPNQE